MKKLISVLSLALLLAACSGEIPRSQVKQWKEYTFYVESRPPVVTRGMNEFLFVGNFKQRGRAHSLIVGFRIGPEGKWIQAVQDGHTGVYRRAMMVNDPNADVLYVHVREKGEEIQDKGEILLTFPLNYSEQAQ